MAHKMSSCMLLSELVAIPLLCLFVVCFGSVVVVWVLFAWLFLFWFVFCFLMGLHTGLRTGPLPALLWLSTSRQPCMIITIHLFAPIERV